MGACLYCGKQFGSFKRIAGLDQFCSESHRLSYQAESNRLALERLQKSKVRRAGIARTSAEESNLEGRTGAREDRPTLVLDTPATPESGVCAGELGTPVGDVVSQDTQNSQPRFRVAPHELSGPVFPVAPAIGPEEFLYAAGEDAESLRPVAAPALAFQTQAVLSVLEASHLETLGYDDPELIEAARAEFGLDEGAYVPVEPEPPGIVREPLALERPQPVAPPAASLMFGFDEAAQRNAPAAVKAALTWEGQALRSRFVKGKNPNAPKPSPAEPAKPAVTKAPAPPASAAPKPVGKATPTVTVRPPEKPAVERKPAAAAAPKVEEKPVPSAKPEVKPPAPLRVEVKPAPKPEPLKTEPKTAPQPEKPKVTIRPAAATPAAIPPKREENPARPTSSPRPAIAARGNAVPVQEEHIEVAPITPPQQKGKLVPMPKADTVSDTPPDSFRTVGFGSLPADGGFWSNAAPAVKGGIAAVVAFVVLGGGYFLFNKSSKSNPTAAKPAVEAAPDLPATGTLIGGGGWTSSWGTTEAFNRGKQISLYRPTVNLDDYRMDFRGQIEKKAMGWMFRAKDPRNYYVQKLEIIRPGLEPVIALVKYAVINGKEGTRTQVMLAPGFKVDTVFRVRVDVKGNKFTTYVQDQLVDYWTDDQLKFGGAGFYNDRGERAAIKTSQIAHLN